MPSEHVTASVVRLRVNVMLLKFVVETALLAPLTSFWDQTKRAEKRLDHVMWPKPALVKPFCSFPQ
jgi:hypothetical protein